MTKFGGQGKKQKCIHRVCTANVAIKAGKTYQGEPTGNTQGGEMVPTPPPLLPIFVPLQTTPELYAAVTGAFVNKPLVFDPQKGMVFDPPVSPEYIPHVRKLKGSGRMINTTVPDGNCLFRSLSKALLGTEKYHYLIRARLLGFVYAKFQHFHATHSAEVPKSSGGETVLPSHGCKWSLGHRT